MSFRLKLASLPADAAAYAALQFTAHFHDEQGRVARRFDPVRGPLVGEQVEYGVLFAYLFRRFGYPNAPWDAARLVRYVLATPRPDMYLIVEPSIAGATAQVFTFVAPAATHAAAEAYRQQLGARFSGAGLPFWTPAQQLREWDSDDPLRPYALAAVRTLQGLLQPVRLEADGAIDLFGDVPRTARAVRPAVVNR